jgi:hypothetical protein
MIWRVLYVSTSFAYYVAIIKLSLFSPLILLFVVANACASSHKSIFCTSGAFFRTKDTGFLCTASWVPTKCHSSWSIDMTRIDFEAESDSRHVSVCFCTALCSRVGAGRRCGGVPADICIRTDGSSVRPSGLLKQVVKVR